MAVELDKPRVTFFSLGCKVNQVEVGALAEDFSAYGFEVVPWGAAADVVVVNTCTVTAVGEKKSRAVLHRARRMAPGAIIVAVGCLAQQRGEELKKEGADLVIGNQDKDETARLVLDYLHGQCTYSMGGFGLRELRPVIYSHRHERTRGFIKIEDGCNNRCSYCLVSLMRGPVVVKPPRAVVEEMRQLIRLGYREIVLSGIHIGQYTHEEAPDLYHLVRWVLQEVRGEYRLRLGSVEVNELGDDLIRLVADEPRMCRHFHVPLQSGSNRILGLMNRRYSREFFAERISKASHHIPGLGVSVDVMVGFPGESDRDFADTEGLVMALPLVHAHIFKYSPRPGTPAAQMTGQIPPDIKNARSIQLSLAADRAAARTKRRMVGKVFTVLVEEGEGRCKGLADNYVPLTFTGPPDLVGKFCRVEAAGPMGQEVAASFLGTTASPR